MLIRFPAERFFWLVSTFELFSGIVDRLDPKSKPEGDRKKRDLEMLRDMKSASTSMELSFTLKHIERILEDYKDDSIDYENVKIMLEELRNRMSDELEERIFFQLPARQTKYYTDKNLFGSQVASKLPQIVGDIEEAGKCLALERPTAAVFHLMRIMEIGVQQFGDKLGVMLVTEKVWQNILDEINKAIKGLPETTPAEKQTKSLYAQAASHLFNVKIAWRNPVMHPKATYTEEEAEDIFGNVKIFIGHLSGKIL